MNRNVTGGPAFPVVPVDDTCGYDAGATWLDVCAWHAMQGLLAYDGSEKWFRDKGHLTLQAKNCYRIAQAMLAEKERILSEP